MASVWEFRWGTALEGPVGCAGRSPVRTSAGRRPSRWRRTVDEAAGICGGSPGKWAGHRMTLRTQKRRTACCAGGRHSTLIATNILPSFTPCETDSLRKESSENRFNAPNTPKLPCPGACGGVRVAWMPDAGEPGARFVARASRSCSGSGASTGRVRAVGPRCWCHPPPVDVGVRPHTARPPCTANDTALNRYQRDADATCKAAREGASVVGSHAEQYALGRYSASARGAESLQAQVGSAAGICGCHSGGRGSVSRRHATERCRRSRTGGRGGGGQSATRCDSAGRIFLC